MDDNTTAVAVLVPIFSLIVLVGLPIGAFVYFRMLAHRERIEMIRAGMFPPAGGNPTRAYARAAKRDATASSNGDPSVLLRKGVTLAFIGIALTIGLSFVGYHDGDVVREAGVEIHTGAHWEVGPWLLGGLIPLFIGLAQLTLAILGDPSILDRFRGGGGPAPSAPPPYYGDPPRPDARVDGPYTYRPGATQELRPPTAPPERRG